MENAKKQDANEDEVAAQKSLAAWPMAMRSFMASNCWWHMETRTLRLSISWFAQKNNLCLMKPGGYERC